MKNKKGVTLLELVLVIIIIIVIATFSVFSGRETIEQAEVTEIYTEMNAIREAINSINIKKELNEGFTLESGDFYDIKVSGDFVSGEKNIEDFKSEYSVESGDFDNLYIIYGMDNLEKYKESTVKNSYDLDSIKHTYLVNFNKGKVELLNTINISSRNVRTFEQVRALIEDGKI